MSAKTQRPTTDAAPELLAAATKSFGSVAEFDFMVSASRELDLRYRNHGPEMVAALRKQIVRYKEARDRRIAEEQLSTSVARLHGARIEEDALCEGAIEARAVLAALDGKDAT